MSVTCGEARVLPSDVSEDRARDPCERGHRLGDLRATPANVIEVHADYRIPAEPVEVRREDPGTQGHVRGDFSTLSSHRPHHAARIRAVPLGWRNDRAPGDGDRDG